ncbi:hypothetical protein K0T92_19830 [Paenibacillus oenotherae]|uniref:Uncharacterized protein n=1 Tax=Paenibacillus oenotherae TaxID=1435645 RepID=A0ABS7DAK3_9BACL|nr:hypothetical protein [Paenibacillus oenotherae]MBW7476972.1 hypothetical protein [Paenibacillus oenotherae]
MRLIHAAVLFLLVCSLAACASVNNTPTAKPPQSPPLAASPDKLPPAITLDEVPVE